MSTKLNLVICVIAVVLAFIFRIWLPGWMILFGLPMLVIASIVSIGTAKSFKKHAKKLKQSTAFISIFASLSIIVFALISVDFGDSPGGGIMVWRAVFARNSIQVVDNHYVPDASGLFYLVLVPMIIFIVCEAVLIRRLVKSSRIPTVK